MVSYILYLTDPDRPWKAEWGGALRLYPTVGQTSGDGNVHKVPSPDHEVCIPPAFNQLSFFAVQPGESFHDVEEVYASQDGDEANDEVRIRMAISGWYHIPQEGEENFLEGLEENFSNNSSLRQLEGKADDLDLPKTNFQTPVVGNASSFGSNSEIKPTLSSQEDALLSENDLEFLIKYIAPTYLTPDTLEAVSQVFTEQWWLTLDTFLNDKFSRSLHDFISIQESQALPVTSSDIEKTTPWTVARPPHKHKYLFQQIREMRVDPSGQSPLQDLLENLLPSFPFYKWLQLATGQTLSSHNLTARRFRRGRDYTLATGYEEEDSRLEITLAITPSSGWEPEMEVEEDGDEHIGTAEDSAVGKGVDESHARSGNMVAEATPDGGKAVVEEDGGKKEGSMKPGNLVANGEASEAKVAPLEVSKPTNDGDDGKSVEDPTDVGVGKQASSSDGREEEATPADGSKTVVEEGSVGDGNLVGDIETRELKPAPIEVSKPTNDGDAGKSVEDPTDVEVGKQASSRDVGEVEAASTEAGKSGVEKDVGDKRGGYAERGNLVANIEVREVKLLLKSAKLRLLAMSSNLLKTLLMSKLASRLRAAMWAKQRLLLQKPTKPLSRKMSRKTKEDPLIPETLLPTSR